MSIKRKNASGIWETVSNAASSGSGITLQQAYDACHPVGEVIFSTVAPVVPAGVTATWTDVSYVFHNRYLKIDQNNDAGTQQSEQLPNIKGVVNFGGAGSGITTDSYNATGALKGAFGSETYSGRTEFTQYKYSNIELNAHDSNSIYQDGGAVRPLTVTIKAYSRTA